MKTIPAPLEAHISQEVTTLCTCWRIVRTDGQVFGFTDHDVDLVIDGLTYESESGYNRTAVASNSSFGVDNLDVTGILDSDRISANDLRNGLFDFASVYVFMVNWANPAQGEIKLRRGWFGEVQINQNGMFETEIRGLNQALTHNFMENFSPECRADFGDHRCKLILANYTQTGYVWQAQNRQQFITGLNAKVDESSVRSPLVKPSVGVTTFVGGSLKFTSGENNGKMLEIIGYDEATGLITVFEGFPYPIAVGDTYEVSQGCDKMFGTCKLYGNQINFRGEPHVPGDDELMKYPDAH